MSGDRYLFDPEDSGDPSRRTEDGDDDGAGLDVEQVRALEDALRPLAWTPRAFVRPADARADSDPRAHEPAADASAGYDDAYDAELDAADAEWDAAPGVERGRSRPLAEPRMNRFAAACVALFAVALFLGDALGWFATRPPGVDEGAARTPTSDAGAPGYVLEVVQGQVRIEGASAASANLGGPVAPGDHIVTDDATRVRLAVGRIGSVDVRPGSRLALESAGDASGGKWQLHLAAGEVRASIFAAPRLFQVGTPAGLVVDLGCVYTARVEPDGSTRLAVEGGRVAFEAERRKVLVPAGAEITARPGERPGTPLWSDADPILRAAVDQLDALASATPDADAEIDADDVRPLAEADAAALRSLLDAPGLRESLVLVHLLDHPRRTVRQAAHDALVALGEPPPPGILAEDILRRDRDALDAWRASLALAW